MCHPLAGVVYAKFKGCKSFLFLSLDKSTSNIGEMVDGVRLSRFGLKLI